MNLLRELESIKHCDFKNYLRIENNSFYHLLNLVRPHIEKPNTVMCESISAKVVLLFDF